jgi:dihydrofolate reductase
MRLSADALEVAGAGQDDPVPYQGLREKYLGECKFQGRENRKIQFAILASASARKAAAGEKPVHVMGGADLIRQALAAGLAGELTIIIAPVTLGAGKRLFDGFGESWNSGTSECASPRSRLSPATA